MSRSWDWWDAWKSGDADESQRALDEETDRSLERDSSRWSWGPSVSEVTAEETARHRREAADRRHHTGKGDVRGGESGERTERRDREWWEAARRDYERQNPRDSRDSRDERDDDRGIFW